MSGWQALGTGVLRGRTVLLTAGEPDQASDSRYHRIEDATFLITEAVMSAVRAVLSQQGRLVLVGDPYYAPLIAQLSGSYVLPVSAERDSHAMSVGPEEEMKRQAPVEIYLSGIFQQIEGPELEALQRLGYVDLVTVGPEETERYDIGGGLPERQCPRSMERVRRVMFERSQANAMICIGGTQEVEQEAEMFCEAEPRGLVYAITTSGGAAGRLPERFPNRVRTLDREVLKTLRGVRTRLRECRKEHWRSEGERFPADRPTQESEHVFEPWIPYSLIMQLIVEDIAQQLH